MVNCNLLKIITSPRLNKSFHKLYKYNNQLGEEILEKIEEFRDLKNHRKLKAHKLKSPEKTYSFSINYKIRIVFEYAKNDIKIIHFLYIGNHDEVYE
jgi:mRNA-degrading endonuclease YafQ of YafQ-DinJ toxin-antitoxin module